MIILLFDLIFDYLFTIIKKSPWLIKINMNHGPCKITLLRQPGYPKHLGPVAFPACSISGTVGPPPIAAGRRPTITRGLALSAIHVLIFYNFKSNFNAKRDCSIQPIDF
jgi:hypothetical protein